MRSRERVVRLGLVVMLAVAVFLLLGIRSSPPVRAAITQLKIMPLGDSITAGTDASYTDLLFTSYRCELYKKLIAAGYSFDFVGSVHGQWGNTGRTLLPPPGYCTWGDYDEEGHSGFKVDNILAGAGSWPGNLLSWATAAQPDIVLVHLGTVDLTADPPELGGKHSGGNRPGDRHLARHQSARQNFTGEDPARQQRWVGRGRVANHIPV